MKKIITVLTAVLMSGMILAGCRTTETKKEYVKYTDTFFESFDTVTQVIGYTETEEEFRGYYDEIRALFAEYHQLYDIYNNYDGINNLKTINDNAGIQPVKVDKRIIDLLKFSKEWYGKTNGNTNIALGAVLKIWSEYRNAGIDDPMNAKLPPMEDLQAATAHIDINKMVIDEAASTVYLEDPEMSLDVGAVAKGYTTEVIGEIMRTKGFTSLILSAGGNIKALDKPLDNIRDRWGIGIQNPDESIVGENSTMDTVFLNNMSVVSSGDYQRYYIVDEKKYHHLIDVKTLMPGDYFKAVTVITEHSGVADALSTATFLLPLDEGKALIESLPNTYAYWVTMEDEIVISEGLEKMLKSKGASGAD